MLKKHQSKKSAAIKKHESAHNEANRLEGIAKKTKHADHKKNAVDAREKASLAKKSVDKLAAEEASLKKKISMMSKK